MGVALDLRLAHPPSLQRAQSLNFAFNKDSLSSHYEKALERLDQNVVEAQVEGITRRFRTCTDDTQTPLRGRNRLPLPDFSLFVFR